MDEELLSLIKRLERDLLQTGVRRSVRRLDELLADDFIEIGESGTRYTKAEILRALPSLPEARYVMHDFQVNQLSRGTVLVTYLVEKELIATGRRTRSMRSSLWQKRAEYWQMTFHQGTPLPR